MNILLATNNTHKRLEIGGICDAFDLEVTLYQPSDFGIEWTAAEAGDTFAENAAAKGWGLHALIRGTRLPHVTSTRPAEDVARVFGDRFGDRPPVVLADDSGISVRALAGRPGVHSAIYGDDTEGRSLSDAERVQRLLAELGSSEDRTAWYTCHALLILDDQRYLSAQMTWHGEVATEPLPGTSGFGYDPVFVLPEFATSVSRLPQQQKDRISHRAQAVSTVIRAARRCAMAT